MIAALFITVCLYSTSDCERFDTQVRMPMQACVIHGQMAAIEWLRRHPFFEFHELRGWECETGQEA